MPLGTLDRTAPPFFRHGPSALSTVIFFAALSLFLMVADARLGITPPLRSAISALLYPVQWLVTQPVEFARRTGAYFDTVRSVQESEDMVRRQMLQQAQRSSQVEDLLLENTRLRELVDLKGRITAPEQVAEVLYDAPDPYTRRVVINRGMSRDVALGSPVIDELGVLGQVTRVYPFLAEVTLLVDRDFAIPVLNSRTGERSVAFGDPAGGAGGALELRFMPGDADVQVGDLLTTSGVDGVYPAGLAVARVDKVERRSDTAFARIRCQPLARMQGARHVMVLQPLTDKFAAPPADNPAAAAGADKGAKPSSAIAAGGKKPAAVDNATASSPAASGVAPVRQEQQASGVKAVPARRIAGNGKDPGPVRPQGPPTEKRGASGSASAPVPASETAPRARPVPPRNRPRAADAAPRNPAGAPQ